MTRHTARQNWKSCVGSALVGPGLSILFGNLLWAGTRLSHLLGSTAADSLGVLPPVLWAASLGQQELWYTLLRMLWPVLLIIVGGSLLGDNPCEGQSIAGS